MVRYINKSRCNNYIGRRDKFNSNSIYVQLTTIDSFSNDPKGLTKFIWINCSLYTNIIHVDFECGNQDTIHNAGHGHYSYTHNQTLWGGKFLYQFAHIIKLLTLPNLAFELYRTCKYFYSPEKKEGGVRHIGECLNMKLTLGSKFLFNHQRFRVWFELLIYIIGSTQLGCVSFLR